MNLNDFAEDFTLKDYKEINHSLSDYRGKKVVLYFYPKDNTSGCTTEALEFKRLNEEFKKMNAIIIGISNDSTKSHEKFINKYELPFLLLSDEDKEVSKLYGTYQQKTMYGKKYMGIVRTTFVLNEDGKIIYKQEKVNASKNPLEVCSFIKDKE